MKNPPFIEKHRADWDKRQESASVVGVMLTREELEGSVRNICVFASRVAARKALKEQHISDQREGGYASELADEMWKNEHVVRMLKSLQGGRERLAIENSRLRDSTRRYNRAVTWDHCKTLFFRTVNGLMIGGLILLVSWLATVWNIQVSLFHIP